MDAPRRAIRWGFGYQTLQRCEMSVRVSRLSTGGSLSWMEMKRSWSLCGGRALTPVANAVADDIARAVEYTFLLKFLPTRSCRVILYTQLFEFVEEAYSTSRATLRIQCRQKYIPG